MKGGHWEAFPTILGGRVAVTRYRLKRWRLGIHPTAHRTPSLGWIVALDVHLGRRGIGFWPTGPRRHPGARWVPDP